MPLPFEYIVVHHSLSKDGATVSWSAIREWHTKPKAAGGAYGFGEIGYNFGVELVGGRVEVFRGRSLRGPGAHTKEAGMNRRGIGVCVVGNYDLDEPSDAIWLETVSLVRDLRALTGIAPAQVIGHREAGLMAGFDWKLGQYKSCPGAKWDMDGFRAAVA